MVDLTRWRRRVHAWLFDLILRLVRDRVQDVARPARQDLRLRQRRGRQLDPFHGYKNAIDDKLADATAVLDAFHCRRWPDTPSMRSAAACSKSPSGTVADPATRSTASATSAAALAERATDKQQARLAAAIAADERYDAVHVAWAQAPRRCEPPTPTPTPARAASSPSRSSTASRPAPSPKSRGWAGLWLWKDVRPTSTSARASNGGAPKAHLCVYLAGPGPAGQDGSGRAEQRV